MANRRHKPRKRASPSKRAPERRPRKRRAAPAHEAAAAAPAPPRDVSRPPRANGRPRLGAVERGVLTLANFAATGVRRVYRFLRRD